MSIILTNRVRSHIDSLVREHLYDDDCKKDDPKVYSRGLAAICLAGLAGVSYASIAKYIVDGSRDNGVDGVYYDSARNKLYVIQAKWSTKGNGTIETGDLYKFKTGIYDLLNEDWEKFNHRLRKISVEISYAIRQDPEIVVVAAFNSNNALSKECQEIIDDFLSDNNTDAQDVLSFKPFNLTSILRTIKTVKSGSKSDVELNLLQWGEQKEPYYAIYGRVCCADIAEWHVQHDALLFSENIRNTLTDSDINTQIEQALLRRPSEFWYLNNGITCIADDVVRKPIGLGDQRDSAFWKIGNLKIVNGAQTTGAIAKAYEKDPSVVRKAYVQIKVISLDSAPVDIAGQITTATNTQNRVEPKDFLALDPIQDGLAESLKAIGVQYCYRRGEQLADKSKGFDLQELAIALAISNSSMANVTIAKRNVGSLTDPAAAYPKIFSNTLKAEEAWQLVQNWRTVSAALNEYSQALTGRDLQLAVHGNRFIEHMVLSSGKPLNIQTVKECYQQLKRLVEENHGGDCYLAVLFKNTKKCEGLKVALHIENQFLS
jgi:hypothetical protein